MRFENSNFNGFLTEWDQYSERLKQMCSNNPKQEVYSLWNEEVRGLLRLLRLFPAYSRSKTVEILPFVKTIEKLIVFCEVCLLYLQHRIAHIIYY